MNSVKEGFPESTSNTYPRNRRLVSDFGGSLNSRSLTNCENGGPVPTSLHDRSEEEYEYMHAQQKLLSTSMGLRDSWTLYSAKMKDPDVSWHQSLLVTMGI